jgi:hypothetical protein
MNGNAEKYLIIGAHHLLFNIRKSKGQSQEGEKKVSGEECAAVKTQ